VADLADLKLMIDEANYPYFEDDALEAEIDKIGTVAGVTLQSIARDLCFIKAGIQEVRLGDIVIPSPREYFLRLSRKYRTNQTGRVARADVVDE
jgi:hypothetical protein